MPVTINHIYNSADALNNSYGLGYGWRSTYTNGQLTQLSTPSVDYNFTYGDLGLRSSVSVGELILASYTYDGPNHAISRLDYGNGDGIQYTYDSLGRIVKETYEDGSTVTYQYTPNGSLDEVQDSATGRKTKYYYDSYGRVAKLAIDGDGHEHILEYTYNEKGQMTRVRETVDGASHSVNYVYDDQDDRLTRVYYDNVGNSIAYDDYDRVQNLITGLNETMNLVQSFEYTGGTSSPSTQICRHTVSWSGYSRYYSYGYNLAGSIAYIGGSSTGSVSYEYDDANQLIRENNQAANKTWTWEYDAAGNILSKKEYAYTTGDLGAVQDTVNYGYAFLAWADWLTDYDGRGFNYDWIGNLTDDGIWTYTWEHGRQLKSMGNSAGTWNFTYESGGLRTKRTNGTTTYEYIYTDGKLTQMRKNGAVYNFAYDVMGNPMIILHNGNRYYYLVNARGDVEGILNSSGTLVVEYRYDTWGRLLSTSGSMASTLGLTNPLLYRGYVYDQETGLYYLQSRYYNPEIGRFINADSYASTKK